MKAFVITLPDEWATESRLAAQRCIKSIEKTETALEPEIFDATTPVTINEGMKEVFGKTVEWTWPIQDNQNGYCLKTGLYKRRYAARDHLRVIACALSHARLWKKCVDIGESIVILEHDAIFTRKFDPMVADGWEWGAVGLNDPRGATRKSAKFHDMLQASIKKQGPHLHRVPKVDDTGEVFMPMGLAGNSAYMIQPYACKGLLDTIEDIGLWPNDALMCSHLFPWLRVITPYYTKLQGVKSTTQG